ncbi:hypothetical protein FJY94_07925 [Candidatus Kaiserbacteria bacterium]|nr:hypothetical protein [Candidatus Kaiserbacteria bacterium]
MTIKTRLERLEARLQGELSRTELEAKADAMRAEGRRVVVVPDNPPGRQLLELEIVTEPCPGAIRIERSYGHA